MPLNKTESKEEEPQIVIIIIIIIIIIIVYYPIKAAQTHKEQQNIHQ